MDKLSLEEVRQKKDDYVKAGEFEFAVWMRDLESRMLGEPSLNENFHASNAISIFNLWVDFLKDEPLIEECALWKRNCFQGQFLSEPIVLTIDSFSGDI